MVNTRSPGMQYDQLLDCFGLFVRYIKDAGWITLSEDFAAHKEIVMDLRDSMGWMVAPVESRTI